MDKNTDSSAFFTIVQRGVWAGSMGWIPMGAIMGHCMSPACVSCRSHQDSKSVQQLQCSHTRIKKALPIHHLKFQTPFLISRLDFLEVKRFQG